MNNTSWNDGLIFEAFDVKTGCLLRAATEEERAAYIAQPCRHPSFRARLIVGDVAIDERIANPGVDNQWSQGIAWV